MKNGTQRGWEVSAREVEEKVGGDLVTECGGPQTEKVRTDQGPCGLTTWKSLGTWQGLF